MGDPHLTTPSPKRKYGVTSTAPSIQDIERNTCLPPGSKNGQEGPVTGSPHAEGSLIVQDPTHSVPERDDRSHSGFNTQAQDLTLIHKPQAMFPDGHSHSIHHAAPHSVGQDSDLIIKGHGKRAAQNSSQTCQNLQKKPRLHPCQESTKRPDIQPPHKGPPGKILQPFQVPQFPPITGLSGHPFRRAFMTLDKGPCSSLPMTPPPKPAEKLTAPAQIPPTTEKSEALCPCVSLSVLLEALHISSFSKEGACS